VSAFDVVGESWPSSYGLGLGLEVAVIGLILRYAWARPRSTTAHEHHGVRNAAVRPSVMTNA
jgi:hypothetical protein